MNASNEDKSAWCELGDEQEKAFLIKAFEAGLIVFRNPSKLEDKYAHDMFLGFPCDLKTVRTSFRTADRYGIDPRYAVTLNEKDVDRYSQKYPHIVILFDIKFENGYEGLHYAALDRILAAIKRGIIKRHEYLARVNDTQGNAKASYVLDARWMPRLA